MHLCRYTILIIALVGCSFGMSREQVKKTMSIMKKQCISKTGVTEDKVSKIEQGVFLEEQSVMCYIACIYKSLQVVKNNKLDADLISKQIDMLYPPDMREPTKKGVVKCMPIQNNYSDMCQGIFYAAKCLYEYDPKYFIFP